MTENKWKHNWNLIKEDFYWSYNVKEYCCSVCNKTQICEYYDYDPSIYYFDDKGSEINSLQLYEEPECEMYPRGGLFSNLKKE